jgi:hypothetical protein
VHYHDAGRQVKAIPWSDFSRAKYNFVGGAFTIRSRGGKKLLKIGVLRFGQSQMARRCAAEINRLAIAYAEDDSSRAEPNAPHRESN